MLIYLFPMLAFVSLAILSHFKPSLSSRRIYLISLLSLAIFSGVRYETGQDWEGYENFFNNIDAQANPFIQYFSSDSQPFELGFYLLNFGVKQFWNDYQIILILSALLCSFSVYIITPKAKVNYFYILAVYLSYSYVILNFAQVRQAIALSFSLIGFSIYLKTRNQSLSILISLFGALFQYSALMYTLLLPIAFHVNFRSRKLFYGSIAALVLLFIGLPHLNIFDILAKLALTNSSLAKVEIYSAGQQQLEQGQASVYSLYLSILLMYIYSKLPMISNPAKPIINYAVASLVLSIVFASAFANFYVIYSRIYVASSIFHALAFSLVELSERSSRSLMTHVIFYLTLAMASILYIRTILINHEAYIPYKSYLFNGL